MAEANRAYAERDADRLRLILRAFEDEAAAPLPEDADWRARARPGAPPLGIGEGTHIENAIIDKNACVGRNVSIRNREEHRTFDDGTVVIREGIVVVPRGAVIPDGYSI